MPFIVQSFDPLREVHTRSLASIGAEAKHVFRSYLKSMADFPPCFNAPPVLPSMYVINVLTPLVLKLIKSPITISTVECVFGAIYIAVSEPRAIHICLKGKRVLRGLDFDMRTVASSPQHTPTVNVLGGAPSQVPFCWPNPQQ